MARFPGSRNVSGVIQLRANQSVSVIVILYLCSRPRGSAMSCLLEVWLAPIEEDVASENDAVIGL